MVLVSDDTHAYSRIDLQCMNMLRHPVWVFDIDTMSMYWANAAAVTTVWNATSLQELLLRDFISDMSEGSKSWLLNFQQNELQNNTYATEKWTFYPNTTAQILDVTCSGIRIQKHNNSETGSCNNTSSNCNCGSIAMLVEVELSENQTKIADNTYRSLEILKHLPVAISEFTMDGTQLIYQNPKALQMFGTPRTSTTTTVTTNDSVAEEGKRGDNDDLNDTTSNPTPKNELLQRFVDSEIGEKALLSLQKNEIFSAETKLYIQPLLMDGSDEASTSIALANGSTSNSMRKLKSKRNARDNDDSTSSIVFDLSDANQSPPLPRQQQRWFNVMLRKSRDPVTSEFVILFIARDISDIVKARKASIRAAMKSEFLDVMAHEIRTPLHQIVGYMDLLEDDSNHLSNEQMNSIQQVQTSCSLLIAIINDLLDCSKLEYGQLQIEDISFSLPNLVHGCLGAIGPQIQSKGLQLIGRIDPSCTTLLNRVISDPNRLRQILHNLLSNAVKFTNSGSITLTVKPVPNKRNDVPYDDGSENEEQRPQYLTQWFRFEVIDTGIGIAVSEQGIVFDRYRQANASVARRFGGTGLGLPICKGLVELLGGTIGLHSEVGKGTTFYFELPFRIAPFECNDSRCPVRRLSSMTDDTNIGALSLDDKPVALNILVVEDNKVNQKVVKAMLERLGHTVTLADNGKIALNEIQQHHFQVILMDVQMPIMDGIECTKYIRNVLQFSKEQLPILGLTAGYQNSDRDYYVNEVGMNGCLGKPLPMEKLKQAISCYGKKVECPGSLRLGAKIISG